MSQKPRKYYIAVGLLYPAALGAGLAWLVPAVPAAVTSHGQAPTWWIVLFAVWFLLYHSIWFLHSVRTADAGGFPYDWLVFGSDLVDVVALFVAFSALGLTTAAYSHTYPQIVYATALLIPVSALIDRGLRHRFPHKPVAWILFLLALGLPVVGILLSRQESNTLVASDWCLLLGLYILLGIYLVYPAAFESLLAEKQKRGK